MRLLVVDHRGRQNVVRTSVTHSIASCATFLFLPHFDVMCDPLLNRRTATWNLFVKYYSSIHISNIIIKMLILTTSFYGLDHRGLINRWDVGRTLEEFVNHLLAACGL